MALHIEARLFPVSSDKTQAPNSPDLCITTWRTRHASLERHEVKVLGLLETASNRYTRPLSPSDERDIRG